jgi:hypothetical protein
MGNNLMALAYRIICLYLRSWARARRRQRNRTQGPAALHACLRRAEMIDSSCPL